MANPTTNYGFVMPSPTDLVTDLPADFDVFGQAVDTQMLTNANAAVAKTIVDAKGDIIAATAADTVSRLAVGANNTVLTADSAEATGLKWAVPAAGGMTLLNSGGTTLSGASTSVSITVTGYTSLTIYIKDAYGTVDDSAALMRINGDTGSNYAYNIIRYEGSSVSGVQSSSSTFIGTIFQQIPTTDTVLYKGNAKIDIFQPTATNNFGVVWQSMSAKNSGVTASVAGTANYNASAAITAISFAPNSGNWSGGTVYVYGVK
jgi:hypothetical protein